MRFNFESVLIRDCHAEQRRSVKVGPVNANCNSHKFSHFNELGVTTRYRRILVEVIR